MTSDEFLDHAYRLLMTPLPVSVLPSLDIGGLMESLREHGRRVGAMTELPAQLPQMPAEWAQYARRQGMYPEQSVTPLLPGALQ